MKKVFLSLAVIAALTVVSCKDKAAETETPAVDTTAVEAPAVDTTAAPAVDTTAAPAAEATPAAPAKK
jgi:PBP1b-binding outer membrane lipoprotein LpoB